MTEQEIKAVLGTEDLLPAQWSHWRRLCSAACTLFESYGYGQIRTPVFEDTRLFVKGTGDTTDIVEKQMYSIPAGEGESLTLRPEGTPPVIRSYLENSLHKQQTFQKFYYIGPMFRRERPQKGRLRQFHQIGVEVIGSDSPLADAETIVLAMDLFREAGLSDIRLHINSIGCADCRDDLRRSMRNALQPHLDSLCEDCIRRMDRNVFRVLDCNNPRCREVTALLPPLTDALCDACSDHHARLKAALDAVGVAYFEDQHLVRGLDYYTRTVFEIKHSGIGARDAVGGGGRYDDLVALLGGPDIPCVGFALGVEPTLLAMESELGEPEDSSPQTDVYVICFDDEARAACFELATELRRAGIAADTDYEGRSGKSQLRVANRLGAALCLLMGGNELEAGTVTLKDMEGGSQWSAGRDDFVAEVQQFLSQNR